MTKSLRKKSRSSKAAASPATAPASMASLPSRSAPVTVNILQAIQTQVQKDVESISLQMSRISTICDQLVKEHAERNMPKSPEAPVYVQ